MKTSDTQSVVRFVAKCYQPEQQTTREERNPTTGKYEDRPYTIPAGWAVYATDSGVRMEYAKDQDAAQRKAERWNTGRIPENIERKADAAQYLKHLLKPGDTVQTILRHVSRSGMMRHISAVFNGQDITWHVANLMEDKRADNGGIKCGGCGMDMGFHLVYSLSRTLFADGFTCCGDGCPSNAHFNDRSEAMRRENFKGKQHTGDGGYALRQAWL